jgi:hypothetical protein
MKLDGSILENLKAAVRSSARLRGHPVHPDTLQFWSDLVAAARGRKRKQPECDWAQIDKLIAELEQDLSERAPS